MVSPFEDGPVVELALGPVAAVVDEPTDSEVPCTPVDPEGPGPIVLPADVDIPVVTGPALELALPPALGLQAASPSAATHANDRQLSFSLSLPCEPCINGPRADHSISTAGRRPRCGRLGCTVPTDPFCPGRLGPLTLRNRFIKAATYEGMTPGGRPSSALTEFHRSMARGGVAMTTVAYGAVHPDGRTFADQLCLQSQAQSGLNALTDAVHEQGAKVAVQLAHCGFFSKLRRSDGSWPRGPSATVNKYGVASGMPWAKAMTLAEIEAIPQRFADAAAVAQGAGFDAVELHLGHGYLLSQFLSPADNRRRDRFGGSPQARRRLPLDVVRAVRERVGATMAVTAKINTADGFAGGLAEPEALDVAVQLDRAGIDALVTSGGSTSRNPLYLLRGDRPLRAMVEVERNRVARTALRVLGPAVLRAHPFEELFFREAGRRMLERVDCPVVLLGGVVSRANVQQAMTDGFGFVQLGRALLADPDLVERFARGQAERTRCTACNQCIAAMDDGGVRCVLDDPGGQFLAGAGQGDDGS